MTEENPVWSPDGRWIAFDAATHKPGIAASPSLYIMPSRGGSKRLLATNAELPSWQPIP